MNIRFWPANTAEETWSGVTDTLPPVEGTFGFAESTAFGNSGPFYDLWQRSKDGHTEYEAIFIPWIVQDEYRTHPPEGFERTLEEDEYSDKAEELYSAESWYKPLDDAQLYWRRMKIGEKGEAKFKQEYPLSDDEAFLSTGMSAFAGEHLAKYRDTRREVLARKILIGERWENNKDGPLLIFKPIDPDVEYTIGADVGAGVHTSRKDADWSVAQVLDEEREQVAVLRLRILPGDFAFHLYQLGMLFNEAFIAVENNNHGYHTCQRLYKDYLYTNFYLEEVIDKITDEPTIRLGFTTSNKSKPLIVNKLRDQVALWAKGVGGMKINDPQTLDEMRTFVVDSAGRFGADGAYHDDSVLSLALANHVNVGPTPMLNGEDFMLDSEGGIDGYDAMRSLRTDSDIADHLDRNDSVLESHW